MTTLLVEKLPELLPDDVLSSLFSTRIDYSKACAAAEVVRDVLNAAFQQSTVSLLFGGRTILNDRYPIVGREGGFFTKRLVGYSYDRKRVTIPTFEIMACPVWKLVVPPRPDEIRRVLRDSIEAFDEAELNWIRGLMDCMTQYNQFYPLIHCKLADISTDFVQWVISRMSQMKVKPRAIFASSALSEQLGKVAHELGLELVVRAKWKADAVDILGSATDPEMTSHHLVHNRTTIKIRDDEQEKHIEQRESVGFLMSQASTIRIHIDGETPEPYTPKWQPYLTAYAVGSEGGDIISIVE
jgi:hypothetical protein